MTKKLIDPIKRLERATLAIPIMQDILENGEWQYLAGSLILNLPDPMDKKQKHTCMNVRPLEECGNSEILREAQYLVSKLYVKYKGERYSFYKDAAANIEAYEKDLEYV